MADIKYFIDGDVIETEKLLKCLRFNDTKNETSGMSIILAKSIIECIIKPKVEEIKQKYIDSLKDKDTIQMARSLGVEKKLEQFTKKFEEELKIEK